MSPPRHDTVWALDHDEQLERITSPSQLLHTALTLMVNQGGENTQALPSKTPAEITVVE